MFPMVHPEIVDGDKYLSALGVDGWKLVSVIHFGEREDSLSPRPAAALVVQYPDLSPQGVEVPTLNTTVKEEILKDLYFMKQTDNPSDAVAFITALGNTQDKVKLPESSPLSSFLQATKSMTPEERSKHLAEDMSLKAMYDSSWSEGVQNLRAGVDSSAPRNPSARHESLMACHSIALINHKGALVELDGRKSAPVVHGPTTEESFIEDADKIAKGILHLCPMDLFFLSRALVPHYDGDPRNGFISL